MEFGTSKVLDTNPAHIKALYRRGFAYMSAGDFDEARSDFKMMISIDKSSEPDATAALTKLRQKEQEIKKKDLKQFKGLFDKKPGEISDVGNDSIERPKSEEEKHNSEKANSDADEPEKVANQKNEAEKNSDTEPMGLFARLWPSGKRFIRALGLQKCSIL